MPIGPLSRAGLYALRLLALVLSLLAGLGAFVLFLQFGSADGLDALDALRMACGDLPGALLTADGSDRLKRNARLRGSRSAG